MKPNEFKTINSVVHLETKLVGEGTSSLPVSGLKERVSEGHLHPFSAMSFTTSYTNEIKLLCHEHAARSVTLSLHVMQTLCKRCANLRDVSWSCITADLVDDTGPQLMTVIVSGGYNHLSCNKPNKPSKAKTTCRLSASIQARLVFFFFF